MLLVVLLHALLLGPSSTPLPAQMASSAPLQWRVLAQTSLAPSAEPTRTSEAAAPPPRPRATGESRAAAAAARQPPPATEQAPRPPPLARPPPSGEWQYRLRVQGEDGVAHLQWQQDGNRYRLLLTRETSAKRLPDWQSEGELTAGGLQPLRFSTRRGARVQVQLSYEPSAGTLSALKQPSHPAPPLTQDRLSWMFQASALAQAAALKDGGELQFWVAGWRGDLQPWRMRADADPEHPHGLRLRRIPPEGSLVEQTLWLDPARAYLPVRLQVRYDDAERWELQLDD